jgi:hypothetical protein
MIYWKGQEDVDFQVQSTGFSIDTGGGRFRSGYARCAVAGATTIAPHQGYPFAPAVTSCWVSGWQWTVNGPTTNSRFLGIGRSTSAYGGIFVGTHNTTTSKCALWYQDAAGAWTLKASEAGNSITGGLQKYDIRIENFGATTRVRIYIDGAAIPVIDYTGDLRWGAVTDLDCFLIGQNGSVYHRISECLIADEDTRAMSLVTLYPNAAGDANTLDSGLYGDIDEAVLNDADLLSSSTTGQVAQFNLSTLPAGVFTIKDVTGVFRGIRGPTGIQNWKFGLKTGGTIDVGQTYLMDTGWASYTRSFGSLNPVTGNPWTQAEIDALQIAFESLT